MLVLRTREGELESGGQWVYAWLAHDGTVYVGATALHHANVAARPPGRSGGRPRSRNT